MKAICINNDGLYLTVGKEYSIISENGDYIQIINDIGKPSEYNYRYFTIE